MRALVAAIGLTLGIALGLVAGWVLWPVEYADVSPDLLDDGFQFDYATMIAHTYAADGDLDLARARLARLGDRGATTLLNAITASNEDSESAASLQKLATDLGLYVTPPPPAD